MSRGLNRRRILTGAAAVGGIGALASIPASAVFAKDDEHHAELAGTWFITVTPTNQSVPKFNVLTKFTADGGAIATTSNDSAPGSRGSVGFGAWVRTGPNTFRENGIGFVLDDSGRTVAIAHVREVATIDASDTYHGVTTLEVDGLDGHVIFTATSTALGTRVVA